MKPSRLAALCAVTLATTVSAQNAPSEVTDKEIAAYKIRAKSACRVAGLTTGDPEPRVDAFCDCMLDTLNKRMKRPEWQQAYFYSMQKQEAEEGNVLAPHLPAIGACRPKP